MRRDHVHRQGIHRQVQWDDLLAAAYGAPTQTESDPTSRPDPIADLTLRRRPNSEGLSPANTRAFRAYRGCIEGIELEGEVGRGGFGVVLAGRDAAMNRDVAVKVLHRKHAHDPAAIQQFYREAQVGGQLHHPCILPVYARGKDRLGRPYFTMPWVSGRTLEDLAGDPAADRRVVLQAHAQVCRGVHHGHSRGLLHGDLKPSNFLLDEDNHVWILDWGFAQTLDETTTLSAAPTECQSVSSAMRCGTPGYMAPELRTATAPPAPHPATDIYALGAVLADLIPDPATSSSPAVARSLVDLAEHCMAEEPAHRPANALQVAARIEALLR